MVRYRKR